MLCPSAWHFIRIASVDSAVKWVPGGDTLMKGVQCYEFFGGKALKNHTIFLTTTITTVFACWSIFYWWSCQLIGGCCLVSQPLSNAMWDCHVFLYLCGTFHSLVMAYFAVKRIRISVEDDKLKLISCSTFSACADYMFTIPGIHCILYYYY